MTLITVSSDASQLAKQFGRVFAMEIPFAVALALTDLAFMGQKAAKAELAQSFTLRNRYSAGGIQVNRAEKLDWPHAQSEVGIDERRSYLIDHVLGKRRKPQRGPFKAVPDEDVVKRGSSGKVPAAMRPKALIKRINAKGNRSKTPVRYVLSYQGKGEALMRFTQGSSEPELVYWFTRSAWIKKRFNMPDSVQRAVAGQYDSALIRAFERSIKPKR